MDISLYNKVPDQIKLRENFNLFIKLKILSIESPFVLRWGIYIILNF
jgi:hypothetical protein